MDEIARIIISIKLVILLIIILLAGVYALPIIFIRRFHTITNLLTCKVCLVSVFGSFYWAVQSLFDGFYPAAIEKYHLSCLVVPYFLMVINCLIIYAFLMITINRYFQIIHPNRNLFRKRQWLLISFLVHWLISFILPLPYFTLSFGNCIHFQRLSLWIRMYQLIIIFIIPSMLNGILNSSIFRKVSLSSQRLITDRKSSLTDTLHGRDINLLKHIIFLHIIFVIGWAPIAFLPIVELFISIPHLVGLLLRVLPSISLLINILDLYVYNHELRQYFREDFFKCSSNIPA